VRRSATALYACTALLAGCGDDDEPTRSATVPAGETLVVEGDEYAFDPGRIVVTGQGALRIRFDNTGNLAHNLVVVDGDRRVAGTSAITGGESRELTVRGRAGRYRMVCTVGDHEELGMTGELALP
jgi:plastocyanin